MIKNEQLGDLTAQMTAWRHHLHAWPEVSGQEKATAAFLAETLQSFGYTVTDLGDYGLAASLTGRTNISGKAIMLRADTDALPITEETSAAYASRNPGVMHACGHDGHMAMLLGAAKYLKENPAFDGTVHFLFQPSEENGKGAAAMIAAGLFDKFPAENIFGLHNTPAFPLGFLGTRSGEMLSAADGFRIVLSGKGGHVSDAAKNADLLSAGAVLALKLKNDFNRHIARGDKAMLAVTSFGTDSQTSNVMSGKVTLLGTLRSFDPESQRQLKEFLEKTVAAVAKQFKSTATIDYQDSFPVLVNDPDATSLALAAARDVAGALRATGRAPRTLGTEDFAYLLQQKPGNYMAMGTGALSTLFTKAKVNGLHSAKYDFNDAALSIGARYWISLVRKALPSP
jgi:amidohydrolase